MKDLKKLIVMRPTKMEFIQFFLSLFTTHYDLLIRLLFRLMSISASMFV